MASALAGVLAADGGSLTTILIVIFGSSTGVIGAIVAFVKLGSDKGNAAMAQATGANEALEATLEAVERERDYWIGRYERSAARNRDLLNLLGQRAPPRSSGDNGPSK